MQNNYEAFRILPGKDLYNTLKLYASVDKDASFAIVTCVGSLKKCVVRMAGATPENVKIVTIDGPLEIVSVVGTITGSGIHVHISVSDKDGNTKGGHLMPGSIVDTTAEVVLANLAASNIKMTREFDPQTGFNELKIV